MRSPTQTQVQELYNKLAATTAELSDCKAELTGCQAQLSDCKAELEMDKDMCESYYDSYVEMSTKANEVGGVLRDAMQRGGG
jgi:chromosome segregation ATPase